MNTRLAATIAIVLVSATAAPLVVSAASTPAPVAVASAAPEPVAMVVPAKVAEHEPATCTRRVRVVYPGYATPDVTVPCATSR